MKLSEMAMAAANFPKERAQAPVRDYPTDKDDYPGVIVAICDYRLAVSPQGRAYLPQVRQDGRWHTGNPCADKPYLEFYLEVIDGPWPAQILAALADLPNDPAECAAGLLSGKGAG